MRRVLLLAFATLIVAACAPTRPTLIPIPRAVPLLADILTQIQFVTAANMIVYDFRVEGSSHAAHLSRLKAFAERTLAPVHHVPLHDSTLTLGITTCPVLRNHCIILLDADAAPNGQFATLIHEIAHLRLEGNNRKESEVIAETIAFLTTRALGLDTRSQSMSYLLYVSEDTLHTVLVRDEEKIREVAADLVRVAQGEAKQ